MDTHLSYGPNRRYEHDAKIYVVRDVWDSRGAAGGRLIRCEYATPGDDGVSWTWNRCREGVSFDEIKPLGRIDRYIKVEKAP